MVNYLEHAIAPAGLLSMALPELIALHPTRRMRPPTRSGGGGMVVWVTTKTANAVTPVAATG